MDPARLDAAAARTAALAHRLGSLERRDAERRLGRADADWDESKHKRGQPKNKGQFGSGGGASGGGEKKAEKPAAKKPAAKSEAGAADQPQVPQLSPEEKKEKIAKITEGRNGGAAAGIKGEDFNAHDYAASQDDPDATPEKILAKLTPEQREEVDDIHKKILARGMTIDKYRNTDKSYTKERADIHDAILFEGRMGHDPDDPSKKKWYPGILSPERIVAAKPPEGQKPTFTILGGRGGSGKSQFHGDVYHDENSIVLDADVIKHMIQEYEGWNANEVHEESSDILDTALQTARKHGLNVVFDATMKSSGGAMEKVEAFKKAGYRMEAHYMHLPRHIAAERAINRYFSPGQKKGADPKQRGRYVPPHIVLGNRLNEQNFDQVRQQADRWSFRDNNVERGQSAKMIARGGYDD